MDVSFVSESRVKTLKNRTRRCVCKYCGGKLKLRRIIFSAIDDARIEIFCNDCNRIEFGVEPEIYSSAKYFVENSGFNCYPDLDDNMRTTQMTIAKVCEIMAWQDQNLGFLDHEGFIVPVNINENFAGQCSTFSEDDFNEIDNDFDEDYVY